MGTRDGVRPQYQNVARWIEELPEAALAAKRHEAEAVFRRTGITFAVYNEGGDPERLIPFDIIPRVLDGGEWSHLAKGLEQRVRALNAFLADCYGSREFLRAGKIAEHTILHNAGFCAQMQDLRPPSGVYVHVAGIDVVRTSPDRFYVLEDNCRTPSGVSYMLENREVMMRLFPDLFSMQRVRPVSHYPDELLATLRSVAPVNCSSEPTVVLLTPGSYNSAYYEHSFLADEMGIDLVEGLDLVVMDLVVYTRTTRGLQRVDVIYRRIDDDYLDPLSFRADSSLGVPGLLAAYRAGNVSIANAVGTGLSDDKAIYTYVPEMIRFFLGQEPLLQNVPTWRCSERDELTYVLEHLSELVVKNVHGSGGYGMLVGPASTTAEIEAFAAMLRARPERYIAQPTLALSTCPTFVDSGIAPRHVDLRPFVLQGDQIRIVPGGLTRVALREGSLVVNSSQGGGTKDTWVLEA
ncbi:MAG TPA: circularly permuted type 2 ATP-grasp protein [Candidatus Binatia bacterium]|nr:circularly permuted type 2 ATP-grasp protein [Candidatus Binatia bacterium]